ncbi:MAG: hypothetical protein LW832_06575, partial [Parachlamydia sp.]|nr:hypothetical protein [Parachlamydia sp.]
MNETVDKRYVEEKLKKHTLEWKVIRRLMTYFYPYRGWTLAALLLLIFSKGLEAWVPVQIGHLTQTILFSLNGRQAGGEALFFHVMEKGLIILGWIFASYAFDTGNIYIKNYVGQRALLTLRNDVYRHLLKLPVSYFDRQPVGRLMTRTIHDVDQINQLFAESLIPIIGSTFLFFSILIAVFMINWKIGLVVLGIMPLAWGITRHFRTCQRLAYQSLRSILSAMNVFMQEHLMGIGIIRSFNLQEQQQQTFNTLNRDYYKANMETIHHFALFFAGIEWIQNVSLVVIFVILVQFPNPGQGFDAGTFFTMSLYGLMVFRPLADLAERYNVLQSAMAAAEKIFEVLDTSIEEEGAQPGAELNSIDSIEFQDVWFAYEEEHYVLKGLSFKVNKGESIALVGMTGSGKTTILN